MPEIIDLEVARRNMLRKVKGKRLSKLRFPVEKIIQNATPLDMKDSTEGKVLMDINRLGKLLIFKYDNDAMLVLHLMLHGNYCWRDPSKKEKNVVCEMEFETGDTVLIKDWSSWMKIELEDLSKSIESGLLRLEYGVDPLSKDFTEKKMEQILTEKPRSGIKAILMDQKVIAGIGNAYADEVLFHAKIHPKSTGKEIIDDEKVKLLWKSVCDVLSESLTIVTHLSKGNDITEQGRDFMKVYRKSGQKCPSCGYMIVQLKVNGRDTFVCEKCQVLAR